MLPVVANSQRIELGNDSWFQYEPQWLAAEEAASFMQRLISVCAWEQREIVLFGRKVMQPRLIAWAGEVPYRYSGQTLEPRGFDPALAVLLDRLNRAADDHGFNHVLINRYRDGRDSMGMHADAEPELGPDPAVASLSLGATRTLTIAPRIKGAHETRRLEMEHGSLVWMGGRDAAALQTRGRQAARPRGGAHQPHVP